MSFDLAPWHLWGSTQTLILTPGQTSTAQVQLARIAYKRPDSWRFLLWARPDAYVSGIDLQVDWSVYAGTGRGNAEMVDYPGTLTNGFSVFRWASATIVKTAKWASQVPAPVLDEILSPNLVNTVDTIVGEDIQVSASLSISSVAASNVQFTVGAFLAPMHHARPEWWVEKFPGNETGGR